MTQIKSKIVDFFPTKKVIRKNVLFIEIRFHKVASYFFAWIEFYSRWIGQESSHLPFYNCINKHRLQILQFCKLCKKNTMGKTTQIFLIMRKFKKMGPIPIQLVLRILHIDLALSLIKKNVIWSTLFNFFVFL